MHPRFTILLLLLLAFPASKIWACGNEKNTTQQDTTAASCCDDRPAQTNDCANTHNNNTPNCPCDHNDNHCHCPGCGVAGFSCAAGIVATNEALLAVLVPNSTQQQQAFYFDEHLPEAVYLPIWQPPQL